MTESLGVDLGNVIIDHLNFGTTPDFVRVGDYDTIPAVPGVFESLGRLHKERFNNSIFVVYNASDVADQKIVSWLNAHEFSSRTGIQPERVHRSPGGRNKSRLCEEYLATHFIDDRLEALGDLIGKVEHLYLFRPQQQEIEQYRKFLPCVKRCTTWSEIMQLLLC